MGSFRNWEGTTGFDRSEIEERLDDLDQRRPALMDESGIDAQVLSVTMPALHLNPSNDTCPADQRPATL